MSSAGKYDIFRLEEKRHYVRHEMIARDEGPRAEFKGHRDNIVTCMHSWFEQQVSQIPTQDFDSFCSANKPKHIRDLVELKVEQSAVLTSMRRAGCSTSRRSIQSAGWTTARSPGSPFPAPSAGCSTGDQVTMDDFFNGTQSLKSSMFYRWNLVPRASRRRQDRGVHDVSGPDGSLSGDCGRDAAVVHPTGTKVFIFLD